MERIILLNSDFTFLNTISWKKAICLVVKEKVEVLRESPRKVVSGDRSFEMFVPSILRLIRLVGTVYTRKAPFTLGNLLVRDRRACQYCGDKTGPLTIEHILPRSRGGKTDFENCVIACAPCNGKKGNRTPREAGMKLRSTPYRPMIIELISKRIQHLGLDSILADLVKA